MRRIVLGYSGGLRSSAALHWIAEQHRVEVVTLTLDLGQGAEIDGVRERALASGAARAHVLDVADEFARLFVLPAVQAGAIGEGGDPFAAALAQPLIAEHLVGLAKVEGTSTVAHAYSSVEEASSIAASVHALDPTMQVVATAREWAFTHRELVEYARRRGLPILGRTGQPYSVVQNLWARSIERDAVAHSWEPVPEHLFEMTRAASEAPEESALVDIEFDRGMPVAINGVAMPLVELIASLQTIAGDHGVGRRGPVASAPVQRIHEAPAATVLRAAHGELQRIVAPGHMVLLTSELGAKYADLVSSGQWHSSEREALDALVSDAQRAVTGIVSVRLSKGRCDVIGPPEISAGASEPAAVGEV